MKCLRIKFILPPHLPLTFEEGRLVVLSLPEGEIEFNVNISKIDIYTSYTLKSIPLEMEIDESTITKIENALILAFNNIDIGLLMNPNLASGEITEAGKKQLGDNVESDFIGVKLVDCSVKHIAITASAQGSIPGNSFIEQLNIDIRNSKLIDDKFRRAIELYNSTSYLSRINTSGRFILLMSSLECLISQKKYSPEIIAIISAAQENIDALQIDKETKDSLKGSLSFLKYESIKRSGKALVLDLFADSDEVFNDLQPVDFFDKAYDLRSKLVHEGKSETKYLNMETAELQQFVISCLKKYYNKYY